MSARTEAKYVYGVTARDCPTPRGTGVLRRRLHALRHGRLAAIVSDAPDGEIQTGREELTAHAEVLQRARERGVVLPMRFGVVMPDEQTVRRELLASYGDELLAQLRELAGKAELRLRAVYDERSLIAAIVQGHRDIAELREAVRAGSPEATYYERIELGRRVEQAIEQAANADLAAILDALEPLAVAAEVDQLEHERVAANVSFLVEEAQIPAFDRAVDELGARNAGRLRFKYTGPLPAYSFVQLPVQV